MTSTAEPAHDEHPPGGEASLEVAAWHLQALLAAISGFDGKIMFLTALNVAGISALIGVAVTSDPSTWLLALGLGISGICVMLGLSMLWARNVQQFPTPEDALRFAKEVEMGRDDLAWRHFIALQQAVKQADETLRWRSLATRTLLVATPIALSVVVAAALTAAR